MRRLVLFQGDRLPASRSLAAISSPAKQRPELNTLLLPVLLCVALGGLTAAVLISVIRRVPEVFRDVAQAGAELERLGAQVREGATEKVVAVSNNPHFKSLTDTLNRCSADLGGLDIKRQEKQQEIAKQIAAQDTLSGECSKHESLIAASLKTVSDKLGRPCNVSPGPPKQYDPGPAPTPWWGPVPVKYATTKYWKDIGAWTAARQACDTANAAEAYLHQVGIDSADIAEKIAALSKVHDEMSNAADAIRTRREAVQEQLRAFAGDPKEVVRWLQLKERQERLVKSQAHRKALATAFWFMDLPTLAACLAMTTTAILRLTVLAEIYSSRCLLQR